MYRNAVLYKGVWLAPGSEAKELYDSKEWAKLDKHLAALDKAKRKMEGTK